MDSCQHEIESYFGSTIGGTLEREVRLKADAANCWRDSEELGRRSSIQELGSSLKEEKRADNVDLEMIGHFFGRCDTCLSPVVGDASIGDHDIELRDVVLGFECLDCGQSIGLRKAVNLHKNHLAIFTMRERKKWLGRSASWVTDTCNKGVVRASEVCGKKALSNSWGICLARIKPEQHSFLPLFAPVIKIFVVEDIFETVLSKLFWCCIDGILRLVAYCLRLFDYWKTIYNLLQVVACWRRCFDADSHSSEPRKPLCLYIKDISSVDILGTYHLLLLEISFLRTKLEFPSSSLNFVSKATVKKRGPQIIPRREYGGFQIQQLRIDGGIGGLAL